MFLCMCACVFESVCACVRGQKWSTTRSLDNPWKSGVPARVSESSYRCEWVLPQCSRANSHDRHAAAVQGRLAASMSGRDWHSMGALYVCMYVCMYVRMYVCMYV